MPSRPMYDRNRRDMYGNIVYGMDQSKERRRKRRRAEGWRVTCVAIVLIIALAIAAAYSSWRLSHVSAKSTKPKVQEGYETRYVPLFRTETNDRTIEWFDAIDPDTGLHLLVNDRGGCMYRLDEFCNVMGGKSMTSDETLRDGSGSNGLRAGCRDARMASPDGVDEGVGHFSLDGHGCGPVACERCGHDMLYVPDADWSLFELRTIEYICPNCLHVEKVTGIVLKRERWQ